MKKNDEIMLSIVVPVYNHQDYIVKALDSIRMQKTKYKYEVLVGEDCSTDMSREILQKYEAEHPGMLTVFYREHNMHKQQITNGRDLKLRSKGKYVIMLEGDDFWTDENKIEEQIRFLEEHPAYLAVAHNCIVVGEDGKPINRIYPECKDNVYTLKHFSMGFLPGQTATVMMRNYYKDNLFDTSLIDMNMQPGDRRIVFSLLCNGKVYCIQKIMSAYRYVQHSGSSFSATHRFDFQYEKKFYTVMKDYAHQLGNNKAEKSAELYLALAIRSALLRKIITVSEAVREFRALKYKGTIFPLMLQRDISKTKIRRKGGIG